MEYIEEAYLLIQTISRANPVFAQVQWKKVMEKHTAVPALQGNPTNA